MAPSTLGALGVLDLLPPSLIERVNGLTVPRRGLSTSTPQGLPVIHFGPPSKVRAKLVALTTLVARTNLKGVKAIDVRVPTAPVLTRAMSLNVDFPPLREVHSNSRSVLQGES